MIEILNETVYSTEDLRNFCAEIGPRNPNTTVQIGYYVPGWIRDGAKAYDTSKPAHRQPRVRITSHGRGVVRIGIVRPQFIGITALEQIAAAGEEDMLALPSDVHEELTGKMSMSRAFDYSRSTPDTTIHVALEKKGVAARSKKLVRLRKEEVSLREKIQKLAHWERAVAGLERDIEKHEAKVQALRNKI
jgi:hypothetical protein